MKSPFKIILGVFIGCIIAVGVTFYILDKKYNKEIDSIRTAHSIENFKLQQERDSMQIYTDSIDLVLEKYEVLIDSFMLVDEKHQSEIDRLNSKLLEALYDVLEALPDSNYMFLQELFITNDTLEYGFSGEQVTELASEVVENDYNSWLFIEYKAVEEGLRQQLAVRKEVIQTLSKDRRELAINAQILYDRIAVLNENTAMKEEEIAKLEKAKRMYKKGLLGAGSFIILILLLL